jgi:hypothetical protein
MVWIAPLWESEHHGATTVPSADRAITCRRRLALNALER